MTEKAIVAGYNDWGTYEYDEDGNDIKSEVNGVVVVNNSPECGYDWTADMILLRLSDGALFRYEDAGCSCNSPLELYSDKTSWANMEPLRSVDSIRRWPHEVVVSVQPWLRATPKQRILAASLISEALTPAEALRQATVAMTDESRL